MTCPSCGTINPDGARFCNQCGTKFEPRPIPVEGERKFVTVLFADVVASTALAEHLDPEDWTNLMNGAFGLMNDAVKRYGGTVGRLMGDAILAFFGAPVAHEDDAERAVRSALEIQRSAREYAATVRRRHGRDFEVRVGINTGLTVLARVGDTTKSEYTAMGDTANVAARLQALARPGTVLVGPDTYTLVKHLVDVVELGGVQVKGRADPVPAYELTGVKAAPGRVRGVDGLSSPLVGRARELETVRERIDGVRAGRGGFVAVVGEAGLGKSRLLAEARAHAPDGHVRWLEGRGLSYAQGVHYFPWRQVLLASVGATDADPPDRVRELLEREACTCCDRPGGDLPFLEAVLAVESDHSIEALADVDGAALVPRIAEATQGYVCSLASLRPTVLVFDDLHWADPATTDLIERMRDVVSEFPLLLVCVLRPDRRAPSWAMLERLRERAPEHLTELVLQPLGGAQSRELLANLLHIDGLPERVRGVILDKTDGNPFFIEEVIRALIDSGHVVPDGERWRATAEIGHVAIPDTLFGVLSARIDRLPDDTRRVAQTAAVIGRTFAHRVLRAVIDESSGADRPRDLAPHLGLLSAEELVRERAREPDLEYVFKHALTQEAAYERLLLRRRKELHRRTGYVLERLHGDGRDDVAPVLAHHFTLGEEWLQAARYAMRAADRAYKLYALQDAVDQYEAALAALERSPDAAPAMVIDSIIGWTDAAVASRMHERPERRASMHERIDRGIELARALGDKRRLTQVLVAKGNVYSLSGFPTTGFEPLAEAHDLARELGDDDLFLMPYWAATEAMVNQDPRGAAEQFSAVIDLARRARNKGIEAHASGSKAVAHARLGEGAEARAAIEQALAAAPLSNSIIKEADVHILAGATFHDLGETERGLEHSRKGTELAFSVRGFECASGGYSISGLGEMEVNALDAARRDFEQAVLLGTGTRMEPYLHSVRGADAVIRLWRGDHGALDELETELANAERANDDYGVATLAHALAEEYHRLGQARRAERYLERALASFRERGMLPYVARALETLAAVHEDQGRQEEAAAARAEAGLVAARIRANDRPGAHGSAAAGVPEAGVADAGAGGSVRPHG